MAKVLILKVVREDMTSRDGFKWPDSGPVECEGEWNTKADCSGPGLYGWLNGEGSFRHSFMEGKWIVFEADEECVIKINNEKCKARRGEVIFSGSRVNAVAFLKERGSLTSTSNPGWCCFTVNQLQELAFRAANRAIKKYVPVVLRKHGREDLALKLDSVADIVDRKTADAAADAAAIGLRGASYAVYYAFYAAYYAAYYAASYAAYDAAYAAYAAYYASYVDIALAHAVDAAYYAAADAAEREACRQDKLQLLGLI